MVSYGRSGSPWRSPPSRRTWWLADGHRRRRGGRSSRTTSARSWPPTSSWCRPPHRLLFVLVILAHERRRVVHVAVTAHPTSAWTAKQLRNAFPNEDGPTYLLHDRDGAFAGVGGTITAIQIQDVVTAPSSPWQNPYVERFIGSIRRECLDHVIVVNAAGAAHRVRVRRVLHALAHASRAWRRTRHPAASEPPTTGRIVALPEVNGLHHRYDRAA